jgi:membrane-associated HD superfamily phosphohydrolase
MIKNNTITKRNQYETQNGIFTVLFSALISCGLFAIIYFTKIINEETDKALLFLITFTSVGLFILSSFGDNAGHFSGAIFNLFCCGLILIIINVEPSLQILSFVIILIVEAILIFRGFNWISILIPLLIVVAVNFYSSHKSVASNIRQDEITRMEGMGLKDVNVSVEYIGNEEYRCKISGYDPGVNTTYGSSQPKLMNATIIYRWNSNEKSYVRVRNE